MWQIFIAGQAVLSSAGEDGLPRGSGAVKQSIPLVAGEVVLQAVVRKPVNTAYFKFRGDSLGSTEECMGTPVDS